MSDPRAAANIEEHGAEPADGKMVVNMVDSHVAAPGFSAAAVPAGGDLAGGDPADSNVAAAAARVATATAATAAAPATAAAADRRLGRGAAIGIAESRTVMMRRGPQATGGGPGEEQGSQEQEQVKVAVAVAGAKGRVFAHDEEAEGGVLQVWRGEGHIAVMCPSGRGAADDPNAPVCHHCKGRGHFMRICPNNLDKEQCYRCGQYGHRGRTCQLGPGQQAPAAQSAAPASNQFRSPGAPSYQQGTGYGSYQQQQGTAAGSSYGAAGSGSSAPASSSYAAGSGYQQPQQQQQGYAAGYGQYGQNPAYGAYGYGGYGGYGHGQGGQQQSFAPQQHRPFAPHRRPNEPSEGDKCFRCGQPGHWTRECPDRPAGDPDGCFKCGQAGHMARECDVCFKCMERGHKAADCPNQNFDNQQQNPTNM
eukprot:CAMPEP_0184734898 /NCGR_PEP_ID=MMETSP0314-20130426/61609_1 /TAXON_ID=38298 /ORGANISM="Rhodella maculata, Strain CCMP 736" /LENGTH=419 /DNA_ID=CAMNT_0027201915 /DNA_START=18 /DNA_END=1279 /DNA_ORIENTATION=-